MEKTIEIRNNIIGFLYRNVIKQIAFQFDPEKMHNFFLATGKIIGSNIITKKITRDLFYYENKMLNQTILGIKFKNPVGLSAGFDKNAELLNILGDVGFGFAEVGSVTKLQCDGNPGVRLERIVEKKSIWVNFGLNNNGADEISHRLKKEKYNIPFAVSIAKTNCAATANDKVGIQDYVYSLKKFNELNVGNFFVLNISCPNAYGGQPFSRADAYESLLKEVSKLKMKKPIFVKLSPDLTKKEIDSIIEISNKNKIAGFIISNLTKKHDRSNGGLSGKMVEDRSNALLSYVYSKTKGKYVLIGVGGVFSAEDAYKKIKLGASLVSLITGMIFNGPNLMSEINQGLVKLLKKDGYKNISEAIGVDLK